MASPPPTTTSSPPPRLTSPSTSSFPPPFSFPSPASITSNVCSVPQRFGKIFEIRSVFSFFLLLLLLLPFFSTTTISSLSRIHLFLSKTARTFPETIAIIPTWTGGGKRFEGGVSFSFQVFKFFFLSFLHRPPLDKNGKNSHSLSSSRSLSLALPVKTSKN